MPLSPRDVASVDVQALSDESFMARQKVRRVFASLDVSPASNRRWSKSMRCELSSNFRQLIFNPSTVSQSLTLSLIHISEPTRPY